MNYKNTLDDFATYATSKNFRVTTTLTEEVFAERISTEYSNSSYVGNITQIGYSSNSFDKNYLRYKLDTFQVKRGLEFKLEFPTRPIKINFVDSNRKSTSLTFSFWLKPTHSRFTITQEDLSNADSFDKLLETTLITQLKQRVFEDIVYATTKNRCYKSLADIKNSDSCKFIFSSEDIELNFLNFQFEDQF